MGKIWIIAKRDFKALVTSPVFFTVTALCAIIWSYTYLRSMFEFAARLQMQAMQGGQAGMNINYMLFGQHISLVHLILIFAIPVITMRLLAEEKKLRTYDLLLTSPISATDIALGKFFGGWGAVIVLILTSMLYPVGTGLFAEFSWVTLFNAYLGLILVSTVYVGIGVFCSSLTESVIASVLLSLLLNLSLWFLGSSQATGDGSLWANVMDQVAIGQQFAHFIKGTLRLSAIAFFLTVTGFFVFMSQRVVESSRWR